MDKHNKQDKQQKEHKGSPDKKTLRRLYIERGLSIREVANRLSLHADTVHYWLKKHGIETRDQAKRSRLRKHKLSTLEGGIKKHGVRGYARELGVHENTLRHFLKGARK